LSRDRPYLLHIQDAIERIERYTAGDREKYMQDTLVQDAVVRNLEVIGEAAKQLSTETTAGAPEIPWREIAGMRDRLIHHYFGIDLETVWAVVENDLGPLRSAVVRLLDLTS
jgi:uncharacterized protein with HEPN domain